MENKTVKASNMRGDEFREAGRSLIGSEWQTRLAERFGVTEAVVEEWVGGAPRVPEYAEAWLEEERDTMAVPIRLNPSAIACMRVSLVSASQFYDGAAQGRWESLFDNVPVTETGFPDVGKDGAVVWAWHYLEAWMLREWYRANGHVSFVVFDNKGMQGVIPEYAVCTSAGVEDRCHGSRSVVQNRANKGQMNGRDFAEFAEGVLGREWKSAVAKHFGLRADGVEEWMHEGLIPGYAAAWIEQERETVEVPLRINPGVAGNVPILLYAAQEYYSGEQRNGLRPLFESVPTTRAGVPEVGKDGTVAHVEHALDAYVLVHWYRSKGHVGYMAGIIAWDEETEGRFAVFTSLPKKSVAEEL